MGDGTQSSDSGIPGLPDVGESIDVSTLEQILEMDDDEDERDFSRSIVFGFFEQAEVTFGKMDKALEQKDLPQLSSLGHFLKGSSATLGLTVMKDICEKIQHFGHSKDEKGEVEKDQQYCLDAIKTEVEKMRKEYAIVEKALKTFFGDAPP